MENKILRDPNYSRDSISLSFRQLFSKDGLGKSDASNDHETYGPILGLATDDHVIGSIITKEVQDDILGFVHNRMELQENYDDLKTEYFDLLEEIDNLMRNNNLGSLKEEIESNNNIPKSQALRQYFSSVGDRLLKYSSGDYDILKKESEELESMVGKLRKEQGDLNYNIEQKCQHIEQLSTDVSQGLQHIHNLEKNIKTLNEELDIKKTENLKLDMRVLTLEAQVNQCNLQAQKDIRAIQKKSICMTSELKTKTKDQTENLAALERSNTTLTAQLEDEKADNYSKEKKINLQNLEIQKKQLEIIKYQTRISLSAEQLETTIKNFEAEKLSLQKRIDELNSKMIIIDPKSPDRINVLLLKIQFFRCCMSYLIEMITSLFRHTRKAITKTFLECVNLHYT